MVTQYLTYLITVSDTVWGCIWYCNRTRKKQQKQEKAFKSNVMCLLQNKLLFATSLIYISYKHFFCNRCQIKKVLNKV